MTTRTPPIFRLATALLMATALTACAQPKTTGWDESPATTAGPRSLRPTP